MSTPSTVLVLGANGRFGQAAVRAFAAADWRVLAQVRRAPAAPLPAGARALGVPLADTAALVAAADGASAVVYAVNPLYTRWSEEALPLARLGLDVARQLGASFMLPGNVYPFGEQMPPLLHEDTPQHPSTEKGLQRQALEDEIAARCTQGLRAVVIRAGDFFGAGTGSWLDLVVAKRIAAGRLVYPGPMDLPHAWAYLPDLARAFVAVAGQDEAPPWRRLHFAGHMLTGAELLDALERAARQVGIAPARGFRRSRMAWWPLKLAAPFWPMGRELVRMSYLWRVPHALDGGALQRAVGPLPTTPIDTALVESLRSLGHGTRASAPHAATA
jgi:nucleoside-diphosphate-sugar epimerase